MAFPRTPRTPLPDEGAASQASATAADIKALVEAGLRDEARERFGNLVGLLQGRATRLAYHLLHDAADADEAVQDAFVRLFVHMPSYRTDLPVESWFTRILVNTCMDRLKSRSRRRWLLLAGDDESTARAVDEATTEHPGADTRLLQQEQWAEVQRTIRQLPARQRLVLTLAHAGGLSASDIAAATGLAPATVRVHLFRALTRLRQLLGVTG